MNYYDILINGNLPRKGV